MNIAICINSKYIMAAVTMLTSLFENNSTENIDIYVLYSKLEVKDKIKLVNCVYKYKQQIIFKKVNPRIFKGVPLGNENRFTIENYYRILIWNLLPESLERILYLDVDIIIKKSIKDFYYRKIENYPFLVCEYIDNRKNYVKILKRLDIPLYKKYFNSGVMLYNLQYLRKYIKVKDILDYIKRNKNKIKWVDQDVLNALFYEKVKFENGKLYNCTLSPKKYNKDVVYRRAKVLHYTGAKPWKYSYTGKFAGVFWGYAWKAGYKANFIEYKVANSVYRFYKFFIVLDANIKKIGQCIQMVINDIPSNIR